MQSFLQYRKNKLQRATPNLSVQEAINQHFDILRLELLEAVELPPILFEFNIITESAYDAARKEDYNDIKEILEFVISDYKCNFYKEMINEATSPVAALSDLKKNLEIEVQKLVDDLKSVVQGILNSARPTAAQAASPSNAATSPQASGSPSPAGGGVSPSGLLSDKQKNYIVSMVQQMGLPIPKNLDSMNRGDAAKLIDQLKARRGVASAPPVPASAGPATSVNPPQAASSNTGVGATPASNAPSNTFVPAPRGHMRPSDGWLAGLKRTLVDPVTGWVKDKWRNFRRRWHNDPMREHSIYLENIFLENAIDVSNIIDNFKAALMTLVNAKIDDIINSFGGPSDDKDKAPDSGPSSGPSGQSATLVLDPRKATQLQAAGGDPKDLTAVVAAANLGNSSQEKAVADKVSDIVAQSSDPKQSDSEEGVEQLSDAETVLFRDGAQKIGLKVMSGVGYKNVQTGSKLVLAREEDGSPFVEEQPSQGRLARYRTYVVNAIYNKIKSIDPNFIQNYESIKRTYVSKYYNPDTNDKQRLTLVWTWLLGQKGESPVETRTGSPGKDLVSMLTGLSRRMRNFTPAEPLSSGEIHNAALASARADNGVAARKPRAGSYPDDLEQFLAKFEQDHKEDGLFAALVKTAEDSGIKLTDLINDLRDAWSEGAATKINGNNLAKQLIKFIKEIQASAGEPEAGAPEAAKEPEEGAPEAAKEPEAGAPEAGAPEAAKGPEEGAEDQSSKGDQELKSSEEKVDQKSSETPYDRLQKNEEYQKLMRLLAQRVDSKSFEQTKQNVRKAINEKTIAEADIIKKLESYLQSISPKKPTSQVTEKEKEKDLFPPNRFDFSELENNEQYQNLKEKLIRNSADNLNLSDDQAAREQAMQKFNSEENSWKEALEKKEMDTNAVMRALRKKYSESVEEGNDPKNYLPQEIQVAKGEKKGARGGSLKMGDDDKMTKENFQNTLSRFLKSIRS
jgi:hypothetical protein